MLCETGSNKAGWVSGRETGRGEEIESDEEKGMTLEGSPSNRSEMTVAWRAKESCRQQEKGNDTCKGLKGEKRVVVAELNLVATVDVASGRNRGEGMYSFGKVRRRRHLNGQFRRVEWADTPFGDFHDPGGWTEWQRGAVEEVVMTSPETGTREVENLGRQRVENGLDEDIDQGSVNFGVDMCFERELNQTLSASRGNAGEKV